MLATPFATMLFMTTASFGQIQLMPINELVMISPFSLLLFAALSSQSIMDYSFQ